MKKNNLILYIVLTLILAGIVCFGFYAKGINDKSKKDQALVQEEQQKNNYKENNIGNKINDKNKNGNEEEKNNELDDDYKNYYNKTYDEIISILDTTKFDKNKFDGKFVIKQNNSKKVLATWRDISNYKSNLYKGLDVNQEIKYSSHSLYSNITATKKSTFSNDTIKDSFDNNNVHLGWSSVENNFISASDVLYVSNENKNKWNKNELGIFIELLGNPSKIYHHKDRTLDDIIHSGVSSFRFSPEFDILKNYVLYWEYDEYYIRMEISIRYLNNNLTEEGISEVKVASKNMNSDISGSYQGDISYDEKLSI